MDAGKNYTIIIRNLYNPDMNGCDHDYWTISLTDLSQNSVHIY